MITKFLHNKFLIVSVAATVLIQGTVVSSIASEDDENSNVKNIRVERQAKQNIFIEYDLEGDPSDLFTVTLTVKVPSDSAFTYTPLSVIGDIGANIRPGKNKRISWRVGDEYNPAFDKEDAQFIVVAQAPDGGGSKTELYIAGGAAAVGLVVAIAILSSSKKDDGSQSSSFPMPPGRPTNR